MELIKENYQHSADRLDRPSQYLIRKALRANFFDDLKRSMHSKTVYVGNLSHFTTEEQVHELFLKCGRIDRIIMGLDRHRLTPCGFCFVIYKEESGSLNAMKYLKGTSLDSQNLEIDLDPGFTEGRQFGRGRFGGQMKQDIALAGDRGAHDGPPRRGFRGGFRGRGFRGRGRGRGFSRGGFNRGGFLGSSQGYQGDDGW